MTEDDREAELREALFRSYRYLDDHRLTELASGNVSCRFGDGCLISPTGATAATIRPESFVRTDARGKLLGPGRPSSELPLHLAIYRARPDAGAIVHTHSDHCVALASCGLGIPGFHYLVGGFGGNDVPFIPYATFGTDALAATTAEALRDRKACLLANHGAVCHDADVARATTNAHRLEILARQYILALNAGKPICLTVDQWAEYREMARKMQYL